MVVYNEVGNDAGDAYPYDATAAGTAGQEYDEPDHNMQMIRHREEEEDADRGDLIEMGVFKPTSGNATKRLRMRQETRETTKTTTTRAAKSAVKQFASQEFQGEKEKMEGWKAIVMQEVARELQDIRRAQEEALEAQRQSFQVELERLEKTWNEKSKLLKDEIKLVRNSKPYSALKVAESTLGKELGQSTHANTNRLRPSSEGPEENPDPRLSSSSPATNNRDGSTVLKSISGIKSTKPTPKSYAQIAASNATESASNNSWTEVMGNNRKRKGNAASPPKVEPEKRRLIFRRQANLPQKSEADLMLVLNESLQKTGVPSYIRFIRVGYSQSGAISGLLTERSNAEDLIKQHSNTLIRAAKLVDEGVIGVEALERWHRLKVHPMPLLRYFGEGRMEILVKRSSENLINE